jgi:hypothetical protein
MGFSTRFELSNRCGVARREQRCPLCKTDWLLPRQSRKQRTKTLATGVEVRAFAAHSRRVPYVPYAKAVSRDGGDIGRPVPLIIRSAKILLIVRSAMMGRAGLRPAHARVLSKHRRGNGGGKNYNSAKCFQLGHWISPFCRVIADVREAEFAIRRHHSIEFHLVRPFWLNTRGTPASWDASRSASKRRKLCTILVSLNRDERM